MFLLRRACQTKYTCVMHGEFRGLFYRRMRYVISILPTLINRYFTLAVMFLSSSNDLIFALANCPIQFQGRRELCKSGGLTVDVS